MINKKYYKGFEGEEEIVVNLILQEETVYSLGIWGCYFHSIIYQIPATQNGWDGFAYYFHLVTGWYDEDNWEVPNLPLFYKQLLDIDEKQLEYQEEKEILHILREMFLKAIDKQGKITITQY